MRDEENKMRVPLILPIHQNQSHESDMKLQDRNLWLSFLDSNMGILASELKNSSRKFQAWKFP